MIDKAAALARIAQELGTVADAPLREFRITEGSLVVPGDGSPEARVVFVGEAPGFHEARQGRPFVGASGKFLDTLLESVNLRREDIFITNVVKDRPPDNRAPRRTEIAFYAPYLDRQLEIIQPEVIVTLGRFAMEYILAKFAPEQAAPKITALHGQVIAGRAAYGPVQIVPLFHPAVALYDESKRDTLVNDFRVLRGVLGSA